MREQASSPTAMAKVALAQSGRSHSTTWRRRLRRTTPPTTSWTCSTTSRRARRATSSSTTTIDSRCRRSPSTRSARSSTPRAASSMSSRARSSRSSRTARVKALVGGRDYAKSQFNRATSARRQPGSSFKPFIYLTAIEHGLTPDTVREDAPINIKGWRPENYTHEYFGPVTLKQALAMSLNTVAVRLATRSGRRRSPRPPRGSASTSALAGDALDRARHLRGHAARARHRLRDLRQWRHRRRSACDRKRAIGQRPASLSTGASRAIGRVIDPQYVAHDEST